VSSMHALTAAVLLIPPCSDRAREEVVDTDPDYGPDADWTNDGDTGVAVAYWTGGFEADGAAFSSGTFGWSYFGLGRGDWVCETVGAFDYVGPAPDGCPDCAWAWDLSAVRDSHATGDACGAGDIDWADGDLDGQLDYSWGFAEAYDYDYHGTPLVFEDVVLLYTDSWFAFAFSLPSYGIYQTSGDASDVSFARLITSTEGEAYYYAYPP
jgi:hypothetical protein